MRAVLEGDSATTPRITLVIESPGDETVFFRGCALDVATRARLATPMELYTDLADVVLPDFFDAGLAPVVSARALATLSALGVDNIEPLDAIVVFEGGRVLNSGHCVINVVGRLDCVDLPRSRYTTFEGELFRLQRMALLPESLPDLRCFRPHSWPQVIVIDEEVASGLTAAGLTGMRITPVDSWVNEDY